MVAELDELGYDVLSSLPDIRAVFPLLDHDDLARRKGLDDRLGQNLETRQQLGDRLARNIRFSTRALLVVISDNDARFRLGAFLLLRALLLFADRARFRALLLFADSALFLLRALLLFADGAFFLLRALLFFADWAFSLL